MREPLLLPCLGLIAGLLLAQLLPFSRPEAAAATAALALLALLGRRPWITALAFVAAGTLLPVLRPPEPPPELDAAAGETLLIQGCVVEPSVFADRREQFTLDLEHDARARVSLNLREGQPAPSLQYGQLVEFEARVRKPVNFRNPGAFDLVHYLARRQIYWTISTRTGAEVTVLPGTCGHPATALLFRLRGWILNRLEALFPGDHYKAWMMQALLIGENTRLQKVWTESFRRTGTYHALVISGIHITMVAGILFGVIRLATGRMTFSLIATVILAWLYAATSGLTAPVLRAAAGFMLFSLCRFWYRDPRILNFLAVIAITVLALDPGQLFEASFQLTFLSVAAIASLADPLFEQNSRPLARGLAELEDWRQDLRKPFAIAAFRVETRLFAHTVSLWTNVPMPWLCRALGSGLALLVNAFEIFMISCIMQVALALPMAFYFHRASLSGMVANIFVVPLMNGAIVAGFLAVFTGWRWLGSAAGWFLDAGQWVAAACAAFEPNWRIPDPPALLAAAFAASLIALAVTARHAPRLRWVCFVITMALFGVILWHPFAPVRTPGQLELTAIDVGQGDSLLVVTPEGKMLVVDGGGLPQFKGRPKPKLDVGEDVVSPYLWTRSIRRLDAIALTHAHDDHAAGLEALIDNFAPAELWTGAMGESPTWQRLRAKALARGVRIVPLWSGDGFVWGGARFDVLAPYRDTPPTEIPRNNDSLTLRIAYGQRSMLLTGDLEKEVEFRLVDEGRIAPADILKAGHHGSRTSTTDDLLARLHPQFAIISAGQDNLYKHPHPDVVRRLTEHRVGLLRTDRFGLVRVLTDGRRLSVDLLPWRPNPRTFLPAF
ncbi:MAG: ComEC/Rec2 family competence protein [Acidobacteriota bacterium]|nr:ComEC/Rec2 family competence protein [Bryobacteraceae bacterium CoA2 C42]